MMGYRITEYMLEEFRQSMLNDEKSGNTVEKYMRDVRSFAEFVSGRDIDRALVLDYKASLEKNYAAASANSMLAALNSFFHFMNWHELCVKKFKVQKRIFSREELELTREEYIRLVKAAKRKGNIRLCLILQTICATGMRVSELQYVTAEALLNGRIVVYCKNKIRTVFIVRELRKKLIRYMKKQGIVSGCIFVTANGNPVNRTNIWREMKMLCASAGVMPEKVFPHNLRHLFARVFYEIEKDIAKLADILGHASIDTTRIYIITAGNEHRRKMESMRLVI